jgi:dUTPase
MKPSPNVEYLSTGLRVQLPGNCYARTMPADSLNESKGLITHRIIIFPQDLNDVLVLSFANFSETETFKFRIGDTVAQLVTYKTSADVPVRDRETGELYFE